MNPRYDSEYFKAVYRMRKREGLCVHCGSDLGDSTTIYCEKCNAARAEYRKRPEVIARRKMMQKRKYDICLAFGWCTQCQKRDALQGKTKCGICMSAHLKREEKKRRAKGIIPMHMMGNGEYCSTCAKPVEIKGEKMCNKCRERAVYNLKKGCEDKRNTRKWKKIPAIAKRG